MDIQHYVVLCVCLEANCDVDKAYWNICVVMCVFCEACRGISVEYRASISIHRTQETAVSPSIPSHARVVIIGGGIVGCSVAYHLTKLGWRDVLVLERRQLSCGTTWHAAGLVGQLRSSHNLTRLASYGAVLYEQLEAETGQATGFRRSGSISVARTAERMIELK